LNHFFSIRNLLICSNFCIIAFGFASCGLPDIIPVLQSPNISDSGGNKIISGSLSQTGNSVIVDYGIAIYYKHYVSTTPGTLYEKDVLAWSLRGAEDQKAVASSLGFNPVSLPDRPKSSSTNIPMANLSQSSAWSITFIRPLLATTNREPALTTSTSISLRRNFFRTTADAIGERFCHDSALPTAVYQTGDSDLGGYSIESGTNVYTGFMVFLYGFSFDYGSIYSPVAGLGYYQVR